MSAKVPRPHVVSPTQLLEPERRLYEFARRGMPLAEIAVRLDLPRAEVERRLDALVVRLGLSERRDLRDLEPAS